MSSSEKKDAGGGGRFGFSKMMGDIKDKLHDTKLEDAKIHLIHQKSVSGRGRGRGGGLIR